MIKNKRFNAIVFTIVCCIAFTIPSIIYRAILLEGKGSGEDDESSFLTTPLTIEPEESFPEDFFSYIEKVGFQKGDHYGINDLTELMYIDGEKYEVMGETGVGQWDFTINFRIKKERVNVINFYDLFLYLQIDPSTYTEFLYFQAYSKDSKSWENITEISNEPINIERKYIKNNNRYFRIFGSTLNQKMISIERLCVLYQHNVKNSSLYYNDNIDDYSVYHNEEARAGGTYIYQPDWWEDFNGNKITQNVATKFRGSDWNWGYGEIQIEMELGKAGFNFEENTSILDINTLRLKGWFDAEREDTGAICYCKIDLYNYSSKEYVFLNSWDSFSAWNFDINWTEDIIAGDYNVSDFYNATTRTWKFRTRTLAQCYYLWSAVARLRLYYCEADVTFSENFTIKDYEYPMVENIRTDPPSPLNTLANFEILADVTTIQERRKISKVEFYIEDHSSEWTQMMQNSHTTWVSEELEMKDFPNGIYTLWIRAFDDNDLSSLNYTTFNVSNQFPEITFVTPKQMGEKVVQLYDYNINISIYDLEDNPYEDPQILIFNEEDGVILDWTTMERYNILNPQYWNYSINPIDLKNGLYNIVIKTNDSREIEIFNTTTINIVNHPPQIEIIEPSLTELITPLEQEIICNVTNEEVINSVEWDLVTELNGFEWKPLIYNSTTEFYEGNFSLLEYEYGNTYFLVINATDDKYNTSLEIKSLQLHPLIKYYINKTEITYNNKGIIVHPNLAYTTEILASFIIDHHPVAVERDFEIYLPSQFDDAKNYYINRGFKKFTPTGFYISGTYTKWHIPYYQIQDTVYCNLEKPRILNKLIEEKEDGTLRLEFSLSSKYSFSAITISNQFSKYFSNPENYDYRLYYQFGGDWVEFDEDEFEIEPDSFPEVEFVWDSIEEGGIIYFRLDAVPLEVEGENLIPYIIFGGVIGLIPEIPFILFTYRKRYKKREAGGWGKGRYLLMVLGLYVAGFIGGYILGWLWFQIF